MKHKETQVFTPIWVTNKMLDLLDQNDFSGDETYYFEPSCGQGDMLIVILDRIYSAYIKRFPDCKERAIIETLFKFYAIEIDSELVIKARKLLYDKFYKEFEMLNKELLLELILAKLLQDRIACKDFFDVFNKKQ